MTHAHSTLITKYSVLIGLAVLANLSSTTSNIAVADSAASLQAVIETRQAGFKKMGAALKSITDQLKSDAPDNAKITAAAQVISTQAEQVLHWFPAGSGAEAGSETDALPQIWKDRGKFESIGNRLTTESKTLVTAMSSNDLSAIKTQTKALADVCSTCHRSFRAD